MTAHERHIRTLTFKAVDRVPFRPGGPRESTLRRWRSEGLPEGADYMRVTTEILGIPFEAGGAWIPLNTRMMPQFEEKVLRHENGHYLVQDWMGAIVEISDEFDLTYLRRARDFVTRKWHKCPVSNRAEWEEMKKRYDPYDDSRLANVADAVKCAAEEGRHTHLSVNGPFWQMREWLGFEGLCFAAADDPAWVDEMAEFWLNFIETALERLVRIAAPDHITINEDMAYKAHAMISPEMTRRWVLPAYSRWKERLFAAGTSVFDVDSDGYIGTLLPLWDEIGINCNSPVEVAAHNDIVNFAEAYPRMAFVGGVDKRAMAAGGAAIEAELRRIEPVVRRGGYIPSCDHGIPHDVSWPNFLHYAKGLAKITGWL